MKKIYIAAAFICLIIFAFSYQEKTLVGRWEAKTPTGNVSGLLFKPDHTYQSYQDKKVFATGNYEVKDSLLIIDDQFCKEKGTYKIIFFADSIRVEAVSDPCTDREKEAVKVRLKRVK